MKHLLIIFSSLFLLSACDLGPSKSSTKPGEANALKGVWKTDCIYLGPSFVAELQNARSMKERIGADFYGKGYLTKEYYSDATCQTMILEDHHETWWDPQGLVPGQSEGAIKVQRITGHRGIMALNQGQADVMKNSNTCNSDKWALNFMVTIYSEDEGFENNCGELRYREEHYAYDIFKITECSKISGQESKKGMCLRLGYPGPSSDETYLPEELNDHHVYQKTDEVYLKPAGL